MPGKAAGEPPRKEKAQRRSGGVGDQVVHIGGSEGEDLRKLNGEAHGQPCQDGSLRTAKAPPQHRQENAQRREQKNVQTGVLKISCQVKKRDQIHREIHPQRRQVRKAHQGQDGGKIQSKQNIKGGALPAVEAQPVLNDQSGHNKNCRRKHFNQSHIKSIHPLVSSLSVWFYFNEKTFKKQVAASLRKYYESVSRQRETLQTVEKVQLMLGFFHFL